MISVDLSDAITIHTDHGVLVVRTRYDDPLLSDLVSVLDSPDDAFRRLAQIVVANDFEVPPFACVMDTGLGRRVFLVGQIGAAYGDAPGRELTGTATSTWIDQPLPPSAAIAFNDGTNERSTPVDSPAETPVPIDPSDVVDGPASFQESDSAVEYESATTGDPSESEAVMPRVPDPNLLGVEDALVAAPQSSPSPDELEVAPVDVPDEAPEPDPALVELSRDEADPDVTLDAEVVRRSMTDATPMESAAVTSVTAKICPCGAANPLTSEDCHKCGNSLRREGVQIGQGARPPLGTILFDDGEEYELTDSFVIGRSAPSDYSIGGRTAQPISVESLSKHVSKAHLEVRLIDWTVNVVDLDSANGTYVEGTSGRAARRLRANVVEQLVDGDRVDFGDRSFTFQGPSRP